MSDKLQEIVRAGCAGAGIVRCRYPDCACEEIPGCVKATLAKALSMEPSTSVLADMVVANCNHENLYSKDGVQRSVRIYRAMTAQFLRELGIEEPKP